MVKIVENANYHEVSKSKRFDARYYYMGEVLNKILMNYHTSPLSSFSGFIKKGIFDLNSKYYCQEGIPFLRISNLMSFTLDEKGMVYIPLANHKKEIKTKLIPGDIALSKIGKYLGKIAQIPPRYKEVNISQNIIGVSFNCDDLLKKYVFLYLTTPLAINQILSVSKQHNQNKLTLPDIKKLKIPLLADDKIRYYARKVDELSRLENDSFLLMKEAQKIFYAKLGIDFSAIRKEKAFETTIDKIRSEFFFTPQYGNPLYNRAIDALSKFPTTSLDSLVTLSKGNEVGSENYHLYIEKIPTDVPFIRTSDIVNYEVDNYPDFFISDEIYTDIAQGIKPGDILFSKDGSIGHTAMITESDKVIIASGFSVLRIKKESELSPSYVFLCLTIPEIGIYQAKKRTVVASTIPHLRPKQVLKIRIPILPKEDRVEIEKRVDKTFKLKSDRKKLLENIKYELEDEFERFP